MESKELPPFRQIFRILTSPWIAQAIYVAAKLKLADRVQSGPRTAAELASETGTHPQALYRLLRALASEGCFAEDDEGRFGLTALAECLLDRPGSQYPVALMMGEEHYRCWGDLLYSIRTGQPVFDHVYQKPIFDYLSANPDQAKIFDGAMQGIHGPETAAMIEAYDFSVYGTVVDIGGGNGSVITSVLKANPRVKGMLYDLPGVIERARGNIQQAGLASRCTLVPGSFFESVPAGGDAYMMRHIIHDWDDEKALTILRNVRKVISPSGKLLVIEMVIEPGNQPDFGKFLDLNMLAIPGGLERTAEQYRDLYQRAGIRLDRIVPTPSIVKVIEGTPTLTPA
jgi:ubiquinone/menaquinone biosynthesis C-methylase UbiE